MTEQTIETIERTLAERIDMARRWRKQFKYNGDEEFLMNIIEDLLAGKPW